MPQISAHLSTGLPGLDRVLKGLIPGDNIVWQVSSIDDYAKFVQPYVQNAIAGGGRVIYFRFASHEPLVEPGPGITIHTLDPEQGFETFLGEIHQVLEAAGRGIFYVFDCLSELVVDWYSDRMLGNFFMLTCPYLFDLETIAYFGLIRNYHSTYATGPISQTTQVLLDVYRHGEELCVLPVKVQHRYSPRMSLLHAWRGNWFVPLTQSATVTEILNADSWRQLDSANRLDVWNRCFLDAETAFEEKGTEAHPEEDIESLRQRLLRMVVSRDPRVLQLAEKYFDLETILQIGRRVVGTGLIGGKSVGMLLARAILEQNAPRFKELLEPHDSFYIGSDVFYTFLVRNGVWWLRQKQRDPNHFLEGAESARQRFLTGSFPKMIEDQFMQMLDYFGESPIIVRSSSLLEDNFGNAFAGKYESVFLANQGPRQERLADFLAAVRTIYASTMSEKALVYRSQRGLLDQDEQMALLVQRVSGSLYGDYYYPQIAGVGLSFNPYVWSEQIDPNAGMLRLVFGMGTRAVDRNDDDYTRVVALNAPQRRPEGAVSHSRQYAQRRVDLIDLHANHFVSRRFAEVVDQCPDLDDMPLEIFASVDKTIERQIREANLSDVTPWVLTFDKLLGETPFVQDMREIMETLQKAYDYPVDIEFTANFFENDQCRINLVQCRPFQVKGGVTDVAIREDVDEAKILFRAEGAVIGPSRSLEVDRILYVDPHAYGQLAVQQRYAIARLVGQICHAKPVDEDQELLLLGPGRWGTTTPSLGVPIAFSDINTATVLCEIVAMRDDLIPDVSLGTHLFSELVEMDILYMALFPDRANNSLQTEWFRQAPNRLTELMPDAERWSDVIYLIDPAEAFPNQKVRFDADVLTQRVLCYVD